MVALLDSGQQTVSVKQTKNPTPPTHFCSDFLVLHPSLSFPPVVILWILKGNVVQWNFLH